MSEFQLLSTEETETLIKLAQSGDENAKEKLLNGNYPLIKSIVRRFSRKSLEYDDLYQLGCVGFVKAINNFSLDYGVKFSTYAVPMIAGEIKRFLRDDGSIKIARSIKTLAIKINKYLDDFKREGRDSPTTKEIAQEFNVEEQDVLLAMDSAYCLVYLYDKTADKSESSPNLLDKLVKIENEDVEIEKIMLKEHISKLPVKERKVLILRYFRGKTQTEIAKMMGVSQVQISRIEAKTLKYLRSALS